MKAIQQIAKLSKRLKAVQESHTPLFNEEQRIKQEIGLNQVRAILEERMLLRRSWNAYYNVEKDSLFLNGGPESLYPELKKLLDDGWGKYSIVLENGVELRVYDSTVTIRFQDKKKAASFIYKWLIPVTDAGIAEALGELHEKESSLRAMSDAINRAHLPKPERKK